MSTAANIYVNNAQHKQIQVKMFVVKSIHMTEVNEHFTYFPGSGGKTFVPVLPDLANLKSCELPRVPLEQKWTRFVLEITFHGIYILDLP